MEGKSIIEKYSAKFLVIIYLVGIAGHLYEKTLPLMLMLTPLTLFIGALLVVIHDARKSMSFILWFVISYISTFIIEVIGVKSKFVFGDYSYGNVLGLKILEVPLIIGVNWVIIVLGAISTSNRLFGNKFFVVIAVGTIATVFDYLLEPIAMKLGYWNWFNNVIPLQNYIAWFIIASALSIVFIKMKIDINKSLAEKYLYMQIVFFLILNIFM